MSKMNIGDIFSIPIKGSQLGCGQIVDRYQNVLFYCVFYSHLLTDEFRCRPSDILLAGITTGAKIKNGDWKVISNQTSTLQDIARPRYKVMKAGSFYVEDLSEKVFRKIEPQEADVLQLRSIVAPIRFERALRAHFGIGEWEELYDKLLYENIIRSQNILLK